MIKKLMRFEPDLLRQIRKAAKAQHITSTLWIRQACREKLERDTFTWHDDAAAKRAAQEQKR